MVRDGKSGRTRKVIPVVLEADNQRLPKSQAGQHSESGDNSGAERAESASGSPSRSSLGKIKTCNYRINIVLFSARRLSRSDEIPFIG